MKLYSFFFLPLGESQMDPDSGSECCMLDRSIACHILSFKESSSQMGAGSECNGSEKRRLLMARRGPVFIRTIHLYVDRLDYSATSFSHLHKWARHAKDLQ